MWTGPGASRSGRSVVGGSRQRGIVLMLYVLAALVIIGMSGMALDLGSVYLSKTKLQNAIDAAALDAAMTLDAGRPFSAAKTAAENTFKTNFGVTTLPTGFAFDSSVTQSPFVATNLLGKFARVQVTGYNVPTYLVNVFSGSKNLAIGGSAIAGPEPVGSACGALPVAMCRKTTGNPAVDDGDCSDGACWGYNVGSNTVTGDNSIGPGNYGLVDLQCDSSGNCCDASSGGNCPGGGKVLRDTMAGGATTCFKTTGSTTTEPGGKNGNVNKGINTRFNDYSGGLSPTDYPPDMVIDAPMTHLQYEAAYATRGTFQSGGVANRRETFVPIIDCGSTINGKTSVPILGSMCMFLTDKATNGDIQFEIIQTCHATGGTPGTPGSGGPSKIVLFQTSRVSYE